MGLKEVGSGRMDWIALDKDRDRWLSNANVVMNRRVPYSVGNFLISEGLLSFSRRILLHELVLLVCRL